MNNWTECYYLTDQRVPAMVYQWGKKKKNMHKVKHLVKGGKKKSVTQIAPKLVRR